MIRARSPMLGIALLPPLVAGRVSPRSRGKSVVAWRLVRKSFSRCLRVNRVVVTWRRLEEVRTDPLGVVRWQGRRGPLSQQFRTSRHETLRREFLNLLSQPRIRELLAIELERHAAQIRLTRDRLDSRTRDACGHGSDERPPKRCTRDLIAEREKRIVKRRSGCVTRQHFVRSVTREAGL